MIPKSSPYPKTAMKELAYGLRVFWDTLGSPVDQAMYGYMTVGFYRSRFFGPPLPIVNTAGES